MKYMFFVLFCFVRTEEYIDFHYAIWLSLLLTFDFVVCLFVCFFVFLVVFLLFFFRFAAYFLESRCSTNFNLR